MCGKENVNQADPRALDTMYKNPKQDNVGQQTPSHSGPLVIKAPSIVWMLGAAGLVFGCMMSLFCFLDYLNGNETASVGIALGILLIPGLLGLWLLLYSLRLIKVDGEQIMFRDILLRRHDYRMEDICRVKWSPDGLVVMGAEGRLFTIYDCNAQCDIFMQELELRGVELDIPGREFGSSRISAAHPCMEKRHFTVRSGYCSVRYGGRIEIEGRKFTVHRLFGKEIKGLVSDLREVRMKENKENLLAIRIYLQNGKLLFKVAGSSKDGLDSRCVFALLRHLKEAGIPLKGIEKADEGVQCLMRHRYVSRQEAEFVFGKEYELVLPVLRKYEDIFAGLDMNFTYGPVDSPQDPNKDRGGNPCPDPGNSFKSGYFFCLSKDGRMVCDKKEGVPLYLSFPILEGPPDAFENWLEGGADAGLRDLYYFRPAPMDIMNRILEVMVTMVKKKKTRISNMKTEF